MSKSLQIALLALILVIGAIFRLSFLDWDEYNHYHPDERYISWVATSIEWPNNISTLLDPRKSDLNPFYWPENAASEGIKVPQGEERRFAYGHLPLYLGVAGTRLAEKINPIIGTLVPENWKFISDILNSSQQIEYRHITVVGRALTAIFDSATILLVFLLGKVLFGPKTGLLASAFLALSPMHVQLSHFFTVDPFLTFFVVSAVLLMVLASRQEADRRRRSILIFLASISIGLSVGSKFGGILLLLPLLVTIWSDKEVALSRKVLYFALASLVALITFIVTNPFAVLDFSCDAGTAPIAIGSLEIPAINWGSCYLHNIVLQGTMVRGSRDVPFVRQYIGTAPFLYFLEMQIRWGLGYLLGLVAFGGFGWAIFRGIRGLKSWFGGVKRSNFGKVQLRLVDVGMGSKFSVGELIVLAWTIPYFITTGILFVKFMRYMAPLTPFLVIYGAAMLISITKKRLRTLIIAIILVVTTIFSVSYINMYRSPHPWVAASRWIYSNISPGDRILSESWDDPLPANVFLEGQRRLSQEYVNDEVNWLSGIEENDNSAKLEKNLQKLAEADYVVLSSNRNYGVIPRLEEKYPISSKYYPLLFNGDLGFDVVYAGTRTPNILGVNLIPDPFSWPKIDPPKEVDEYLNGLAGWRLGRFDESFTVYDQPLVILFKNTERLSSEEMGIKFSDN